MKCLVNNTKQKLIDTAFELLWTHSYGAVSVDDICKAACVKKGSFYHFFPSKVDLAIAAMEQSSAVVKPDYDRIFSPGNDPVKRFEDYADYMCAGQEEAVKKFGRVCGCPCASLGSEIAGQEAGVRAKFDQVTVRQERYFENALRDMVAEGLLSADTDTKAKAKEINAYVLGQLMVARIQNDLVSLKRNLKPGLLQVLGIAKEAKHVA
jgi:TetR/AcrR family transcriptional repressor of nem operon